ncbi:MAG: membrane dipeptidase [Clostridia bacterium]|nr:membrane dipeptidase [Clostridia bacterium]
MIFDLHNDFPTAHDCGDYQKYYRETHGHVPTAAIWTTEMRGDVTRKVLDIRDRLYKARDGKMTYVAIEDIGFLASGDGYKNFPFGYFRYCSLTWNYDNGFAGGASESGGLTAKGRAAIEYIINGGCLLDVAHLNRRSFFDVMNATEGRVICSHTGFNNHLRSLDDGMIKEIIARNGIIGLSLVTAFTGAANGDGFVAVIDRFVQKHGIDTLALGTDYNGSTDIPSDLSSYHSLEAAVRSLSGYGYTDFDINKILCGNAQRML